MRTRPSLLVLPLFLTILAIASFLVGCGQPPAPDLPPDSTPTATAEQPHVALILPPTANSALIPPAIPADKSQPIIPDDPLPVGAKCRLGTARFRVDWHAGAILTPDGKYFFARNNGRVVTLDALTGAGLKPPVLGRLPQQLSLDGKRAAHSEFNEITVWDTTTGDVLVSIKNRRPFALSANGKTLAIGIPESENLPVQVWDVDTNKEIKSFSVLTDRHAEVAISGDGQTLATWGRRVKKVVGENDPSKLVQFWEVATGKELSTFRLPAPHQEQFPEVVVVSPDGALAAVAQSNNVIHLVNTKTGIIKHILLGRESMGAAMSFSPDGSTLAAIGRDRTVQRWRITDGMRLSTTEPPVTEGLASLSSTNPYIVAVDADKAFAWMHKGGVILLWEVPSGKLLTPTIGHNGPLSSVMVTRDNKFVVTAAKDGTVRKWELTTGKPTGEIALHPLYNYFSESYVSVRLSSDLTHALLKDVRFQVYDLATGVQQFRVPVAEGGDAFVEFSSDGSRIVATDTWKEGDRRIGQVIVWDAKTAKLATKVKLSNYTSLVADITPDGKTVITAGELSATKKNRSIVVTTWDAATGTKRGEFTEEIRFDRARVTVANNNTAVVVKESDKLIAVDLETGKAGKTFPLGRSTANIPLVFNPDGTKLAIACREGLGEDREPIVLVLDWPSGVTQRRLTLTGNPATALAFSPDGKYLVTGHDDSTAIVWEVASLPPAK